MIGLTGSALLVLDRLEERGLTATLLGFDSGHLLLHLARPTAEAEVGDAEPGYLTLHSLSLGED